MDELVSFGSHDYWVLTVVLVVARGSDLLSTWIATPNLVLEGNPVARWLGWRGGVLVNLILCATMGLWPFPAIAISTTSVLVAARNLQAAWLMRSMGELAYRGWMLERLAGTRRGLFLFCLLFQVSLLASVGGGLLWCCGSFLVPAGIGFGIVLFALAILVFTLLSSYRVWRSPS